jgi:hypothetical protein
MIMGDRTMKQILASTLIVLLIGGCANSEPRRLDANLGNSIAGMIEGQTHNPYAAATGPSPVMGMDGQKAEGNLEAYRQDVQKKTQVNNVINIGVGR